MLATLGTQLARAARSRRPVLLVSVDQYESAVAAVNAAAAEKTAIGLVVDDVTLIKPILALAAESAGQVIVIGRCADQKSAASLCSYGVGGIMLVVSGEPNPKVISAVASRAAAAGIVVATEFEMPPADPIHLVGGGAALVCVTGVEWMKKPSSYLELKADVRLPMGLVIDEVQPRSVRGMLKTGLSAIWLRTGVEEAYLGGLRTALRNRSALRSHHYLPYAHAAAGGAVRSAIEAYIKE